MARKKLKVSQMTFLSLLKWNYKRISFDGFFSGYFQKFSRIIIKQTS